MKSISYTFLLIIFATSIQAASVARKLMAMFCLQVVPLILKSDSGAEFIAQVMREIVDTWKDVAVLHGRARRPKLQGSAENPNQDVQQMFSIWLCDRETNNWV
jgi:hypothetical protein